MDIRVKYSHDNLLISYRFYKLTVQFDTDIDAEVAELVDALDSKSSEA